jgi:hypothetical protein
MTTGWTNNRDQKGQLGERRERDEEVGEWMNRMKSCCNVKREGGKDMTVS